jgi:hypothetical protein
VKLYPQVDRQKGTLRVEVQIETPDEFPVARHERAHHVPRRGRGAGRTTTAILVPQSALRTDDAGTFVWVVRNARVQRVGVATGKDFGEQVQVTSGLAATRRSSSARPPPLQAGQAVATNS